MQRAVFSFQVELSKNTRVDNTRLVYQFDQVCLSRFFKFIDPFNNPIIKLRFYVLNDETPFCLLIFRSDTPLLKSDYRK